MSTTVSLILRLFGWDQWCLPPLVVIDVCDSIIGANLYSGSLCVISIPVEIDVFDVIEVN